MKNYPSSTILASLAFLAAWAVLTLPLQAQTTANNSTREPVVVELFTAEGCSSCPPAEAIARKMEQQVIPGADLIVLEEHVTYWNHGGWIDPFSSSEWTERQSAYVSKLARDTLYTPEMVVDGEMQFTGSNGRVAQAAIEKALLSPETDVTITDTKVDPKGVDDFKVSIGKLEGSSAGDSAEVWIALTEDGLHSAVSAGENAGHTLYHAAVLRYLHKIGVAESKGDADSFTGHARVKVKSKWKPQNINIIALVQEKKSLRIIGAAEIKLPT